MRDFRPFTLFPQIVAVPSLMREVSEMEGAWSAANTNIYPLDSHMLTDDALVLVDDLIISIGLDGGEEP